MTFTRNPVLARGLDQTFPAIDIIPVVPNDGADLAIPARALRCTGTAGTLRITTYEGNVRNTTIAAGEVLTAYVIRVHATGTAATGLEAMI